MDAMSVCAAVGAKWNGLRQKFRLSWHMGLFQFMMPMIGWAGGKSLAGIVVSFGSYLAAAMVFAVGAKMLYEAVKSHPGAVAEGAEQYVERHARLGTKDPTRGWSLVALAVATSVDALVVGFSLGVSNEETAHIWLAALIIGIVAAAMSLVGVIVGKWVGRRLGRPAEVVGALVLIGLGVSFLVRALM
jgi:putative Mn2+ efflux pump MntP